MPDTRTDTDPSDGRTPDRPPAVHPLEHLLELGRGAPPGARTGSGSTDPNPGWVPRDAPANDTADTPGDRGSPDARQSRWRDRWERARRERVAAVRLDPGRRGVWAVAVVVVLVAAVVGWRVLADRPTLRAPVSTVPAAVTSSAGPSRHPSGLPAANGSSGAPAARPSGSSSMTAVVVDVVGRVRRPGLVRLPPGARVDDALRAAGGPLAGTDLSDLNLARVVVDGEQIAVGVAAAPPGPSTAGGPAPGSGAAPGAPVNLNTASLEQLDALPGVGPVLAQRILDWRGAHGRFDSVDQLNDVSGIGEAKFADLKDLVTV